MAKNEASPAASSRRARASNAAPSLGVKAPAFRLLRDGGGSVSLADFAGRTVVLYFYPRADTTGCTREALDFSRLKGAFARPGTVIVGISGRFGRRPRPLQVQTQADDRSGFG